MPKHLFSPYSKFFTKTTKMILSSKPQTCSIVQYKSMQSFWGQIDLAHYGTPPGNLSVPLEKPAWFLSPAWGLSIQQRLSRKVVNLNIKINDHNMSIPILSLMQNDVLKWDLGLAICGFITCK